MQVLVAVAILALVIASGVVGVRMLSLWRRTRHQPELLLGLMLLLLAVLGYPLLIASRAEGALGFAVAWPLYILATVCANSGFVLLYAFTWRTFRPGARWAAWLTAAVALGYVVTALFSGAATFAAGTIYIDDVPLWRRLISIVCSNGAYGWAAWESLRYYARLRRQLALGIGEAVVCDRVLLWGIMSSIAWSGIALNNVASLLGVDVLASQALLLLTAGVGVSQALFLWLTFLPPGGYLQWVERRYAATESLNLR